MHNDRVEGHEYAEIYKKQSRETIERNTLVHVNAPANTERSDGPY